MYFLDLTCLRCPIPLLKIQANLAKLPLIALSDDPVVKIDLGIFCKQNSLKLLLMEYETSNRDEFISNFFTKIAQIDENDKNDFSQEINSIKKSLQNDNLDFGNLSFIYVSNQV